MTEKRRPSFDLHSIKKAFSNVRTLEITVTAMKSAAELGFDRNEIIHTIQAIQSNHFYKSMTSEHNHQIWQDVYHVPTAAGILYIKFSNGVISQFSLVSFKLK